MSFFLASGGLSNAAQERMTLAQKLEIARRMADEAAEGKAESGRVVSGEFSFSEIMAKYRAIDSKKVRHSNTEVAHAPISDDNDITEITKIKESIDGQVQSIENKRMAEEILIKANEAKKKIETAPTPVIEVIGRPDDFPRRIAENADTKSLSESAKTQKDDIKKLNISKSDKIEISKTTLELSSTQTSSQKDILPKPAADTLAAKAATDAISAPKSESSISQETSAAKKPKYVVDTSGKDFVNGFYVGKIDDKSIKAENSQAKTDAPAKPKEPAAPRYYNTQNSMFYLVSDNYQAMSVGIDFIKATEEIFNDFFASNSAPIVFTRKVTLQLVSDKDFKMDGQFSVINYKGGDITLAAKWVDDLDFDGFCKLISGAALRKIILENGDLQNWKNPPYWLELAFSQVLAQKMRFGTAIDLARISAENPPKNIDEILSYSRDDNIDNGVKEANSYWLLKSIEKASRNRQMLSSFMKFASVPRTAPEMSGAMATAFTGGLYDFNLWWRCLFTGEVWSRLGGVSTPDWSDSEIVRLAVIQTNSKDGERVGVSDSAIFENNKNISAEIADRVVEIKLSLMRINPLYYNTLISLGRMYEAAAADDDDEFKKAHSQFISDFSNARVLSARVKKLMKSALAKKAN